MPVVLGTMDVRAYEINTVALGLPLRYLMENAGSGVARIVWRELGDMEGKRVAVLAGKGGNAGDGFVAARHLAGLGAEVDVIMLYKPEEVVHEDASFNLSLLSRLDSVTLRRYPSSLEGYDVVIDAILGTGVRGELRDPIRRAVEQASEADSLRVAVDVPTGIDPDTGRVHGTAFKADITVTMQFVKKGLLAEEARPYVGRIETVNIGVPPDAWVKVGPGDVAARLRRRPRTAHKGEGGRIAVIGGSHRYVGAPWLASLAALAGGADLVFLFSVEPVVKARFSPEIIAQALSGDVLEERHVDSILRMLEELGPINSVVVGPGIGLAKETRHAVALLIENLKNVEAIVVDADGLKIVAEEKPRPASPMALTPHLGEASRLLGRKVEDTKEARIEAARSIAESYESVALVKGWLDVIADNEKYRVNDTGVPEMSVGGTGDILSGLLGGLVARAPSLFDAACMAAYVNGLAGELALRKHGAAHPTMLLEEIPLILRDPLAAHLDARMIKKLI